MTDPVDAAFAEYDHSEAINEVVRLRARVERLEKALRELLREHTAICVSIRGNLLHGAQGQACHAGVGYCTGV